MSKVTLTFEDVDGQVGMTINLEGGFNPESNAHKTANMVLNWLDGIHQVIQTGDALEAQEAQHRQIQDVEPRLVKTPDELNAIKAASLAHLADRRIEVVRG